MAAEDEAKPQQQTVEKTEQQQLKYLEFVQFATIQAVMRAAILYTYAKDHSGPLKPGVDTVEEAVKTVVAPVYEKFHQVPSEFLKYVDRKVDESVSEIDRHVPANVKVVSSQARTVVSEVRRTGVVESASGLAKNVYIKYEPKAEQCAVSAWKRLNQLPLFPSVASAVLPKAAYCTEKYNEAVVSTAQKVMMVEVEEIELDLELSIGGRGKGNQKPKSRPGSGVVSDPDPCMAKRKRGTGMDRVGELERLFKREKKDFVETKPFQQYGCSLCRYLVGFRNQNVGGNRWC